MILDVIGMRCHKCEKDFGNMASDSTGYAPEELIDLFDRLAATGVKPLCNECLSGMPGISRSELDKMK
jgi:hypothetical protein